MLAFGSGVYFTYRHRNDRPRTEMELESLMFIAEQKRLEKALRKPFAQRIVDAAMAQVPAWLRDAWTKHAEERMFVAECARLMDTSPHLLSDIGVEEVVDETPVSVSVTSEGTTRLVHGAIVNNKARKFFAHVQKWRPDTNESLQFGH